MNDSTLFVSFVHFNLYYGNSYPKLVSLVINFQIIELALEPIENFAKLATETSVTWSDNIKPQLFNLQLFTS